MAIHYTIHGNPITKKNSMRMVTVRGRTIPLPSKQFVKYQDSAMRDLLPKPEEPISYPVNIEVKYYMPTRRKVDLTNLLEATDDILVKAGILADDNCTILVSHDGSAVFYNKVNPHVEIHITERGGTFGV